MPLTSALEAALTPSWRASQHAAPSDNSATPASRASASPACVAEEPKTSLIARSGAARRATPAPTSITALTTKNGASAVRPTDPILVLMPLLCLPCVVLLQILEHRPLLGL